MSSGVEGGEKLVTEAPPPGKDAAAGKPVDFLSSALSQAQIDLDPFQFIEEDEPSSFTRLSHGQCCAACAPSGNGCCALAGECAQ